MFVAGAIDIQGDDLWLLDVRADGGGSPSIGILGFEIRMVGTERGNEE